VRELKIAFWSFWLGLGALGVFILMLSGLYGQGDEGQQPVTPPAPSTETVQSNAPVTGNETRTDGGAAAFQDLTVPAMDDEEEPTKLTPLKSGATAPKNLDDALRVLQQDLGKPEGDTRIVEEDGVLEDRPIGQRTIAVVRDGPSPVFDAKLKLIKYELSQLVPDATRYDFVEKTAYTGNWTLEGAVQSLEAALQDKDVDIVVTLGLISTSVAASPELELNKPVVSAHMQTTDIFGVEVNDNGSAAKKNFSFILLPDGLADDLKTFHDMMRFNRTSILVDSATYQALSGRAREVQRSLQSLPFRVSFLPASGSPDTIAANAKSVSPRGVVLGPMMRIAPEEKDRIIAALNKRGVATFSLPGRGDVERGALAALFPESEDIIARRVALNLNQLMLGMTTADLPVYIALQQQLVINARTANQIGYSPSFRILMVANILYAEELDRGKPLTIEQAMQMAAVTNVDLVVARGETNLSEALKNIDRSFLLPQIYADMTYFHVDGETVRLSQGSQPESLLTTGLSVRQVIFSDELVSNFLASRNRFRSEQLQYRSVRLDVMALAADRFIDLLAAESLLQIEIDNLRLTQTNLRIARIRLEVGDANPSEMLRWQSQEAQGRGAVFLRESDVGVALAALNQALGVPGGTRWDAQDIILPDGDMHFLGNGLKDYVTNPEQLDRFREYSVFLALRNSPSLQAIDELVGAEKIELAQKQRSFFVPEIEAGFDVDHVLNAEVDNRVNESDVIVRNPWQAQIVASLPLFEGGRRFSEVYKNRSERDIVIGNRITAGQFIDQATRTAILGIEGTYPNIELSRLSRRSAEQNLDLVRQQYQEGAVSILDLIDAQNQAFSEKQRAALAVYEYLRNLYDYQRAISWFELGKSSKQRDRWLKNMGEGMRQMRKIEAATQSTGTREAARAQGLGE